MCEPVTILAATAVIASAASAGFGIAGQDQQRKAQSAYRDKQIDANIAQMHENRNLATKAYLDQASAANANLMESREAAAAANFDEGRKANESRGQVLAAAAESGTFGVSLDALLGDFNRHEAMFASRNEQNLLFKQQQTARAITGYQNEATARTNQIKPMQPAPIAPVDYVGPILQVVQTGANTGMNYMAAANKGAKE